MADFNITDRHLHHYYEDDDMQSVAQLLHSLESSNFCMPEKTEPITEPNFFDPTVGIQLGECLDVLDANNDVLVGASGWDKCNQSDGFLNRTLPPDDYAENLRIFPPDYGRYNHQEHYLRSTCTEDCESLRNIVLCNGTNLKRLDVHGKLGTINHVVLKKYDARMLTDISDSQMSTDISDSQVFNFSNKSISSFKQFLVRYLEDSKQEGFALLEDPLSTFYDALAVRFRGDSLDDLLLSLPNHTVTDDPQTSRLPGMNQLGARSSEMQFPKLSLSQQRVRTGKMKLNDFTRFFNLPIQQAARKLNVCASVMKKICRKGGLRRWPFRKIRSIRRKIESQKRILHASNDEEGRARAQANIRILQQEVTDIFERFNLSADAIQQLINS